MASKENTPANQGNKSPQLDPSPAPKQTSSEDGSAKTEMETKTDEVKLIPVFDTRVIAKMSRAELEENLLALGGELEDDDGDDLSDDGTPDLDYERQMRESVEEEQGRMDSKDEVPAQQDKPPQLSPASERPSSPKDESAKTETITNKVDNMSKPSIKELAKLSHAELREFLLSLGYEPEHDDGKSWPEDKTPGLDYEKRMLEAIRESEK